MGYSQLKKLSQFKRRRREIVNSYNEAFYKVDFITCPYERENIDSCFHLYVVKVDFEKIGKSREKLMNELQNKNIGTQVHYIPVHLQPYYRKKFKYKINDYPKAEKYYEQCLSLPLYPKMTDDDTNYVIEQVKMINGAI